MFPDVAETIDAASWYCSSATGSSEATDSAVGVDSVDLHTSRRTALAGLGWPSSHWARPRRMASSWTMNASVSIASPSPDHRAVAASPPDV
jgi:hypothetical protein